MLNQLRLLAVFAHPDDESLGNGGMLARYAAEGVETYLITATRGEQGWFGRPEDNPGPEALGKIREGELREAAEILGIREVNFLDYRDGELNQADPDEVVRQIAEHIRRIRPHVVVTFDPAGVYGHPDHIAICQLATSAVAAAADVLFQSDAGQAVHSVSKLYYMALTDAHLHLYESVFGEFEMEVDGEVRRSSPWPDWAITTHIDCSAHWQRGWEAVSRHRSQLPGYQALLDLPEEEHVRLWGTQSYYRVFGPTSNSRGMEDDLFAGLRDTIQTGGHGELHGPCLALAVAP
jgi:LmbE family N-acetylglucosaminyl deacetylase